MPRFVTRWLPLALIALAALWLRTHDLGARPMHTDEANQAVKLGELLETGRYAFDPHDHHGPTLYYFAAPIAWLKGETTLAALTENTVRLLPALAGTLSVLLLAALARSQTGGAGPLGPPEKVHTTTGGPSGSAPTHPPTDFSAHLPALAAAAFLAISPPAVYYSRYFIQETLLVTFTLGAFVCIKRWWHGERCGWALAAGACIGLMLATKASAPLFLAAGAIACLALPRRAGEMTERAEKPARAHSGNATRIRHVVFALLTALLVAALFYSSFGTHLPGLQDALRVYTFATEKAAVGGGHEKPWWYYLRLFTWQRDGGLVWEQLAFSALAVCGAGLTLSGRLRSGIFRWAIVYTVIVAVVLSLTPYKTPWHAVHFVPGLALLAAGALAAIPRWWIGAILAVVVLKMQFSQTQLAVFMRPADPRNPYAYVHSSPDVTKFRALAEAALAHNPENIVRVISEEYWPLPWYFRGLQRVGYWAVAPDDCDAALIITSETLADSVRAKLHGTYRETYLGLRPGFLCIVFTRVP